MRLPVENVVFGVQARIISTTGTQGVNNAILELQTGPKDKIEESENQQLQSAIPGVRPIHKDQSASKGKQSLGDDVSPFFLVDIPHAPYTSSQHIEVDALFCDTQV